MTDDGRQTPRPFDRPLDGPLDKLGASSGQEIKNGKRHDDMNFSRNAQKLAVILCGLIKNLARKARGNIKTGVYQDIHEDFVCCR